MTPTPLPAHRRFADCPLLSLEHPLSFVAFDPLCQWYGLSPEYWWARLCGWSPRPTRRAATGERQVRADAAELWLLGLPTRSLPSRLRPDHAAYRAEACRAFGREDAQ